AGAAMVIEDGDLRPARIAREVAELLGDDERLRAMAAASRSLAKPDAAARIAAEILSACPS
ncbi:MAG: UDP-N-acetylglucosamine--N-acetylmuramyl-(pentapeptide) pyrophosphoryl-undecaprenol N-acetylglucosamine transferase, partial [Actinomycetota bacterium]|nr:UDP-N-acetylglucosamine--N-acetylmuramyl-(pentapeptide) pyrophosphoryl-undecaprenol N-acetylglucosamine transferase [Actinomycetota bacterium]